MQLKIEQDVFDRLMKFAKEVQKPYRKLAMEAMRIGVEVLWHKYYTDARVVVLHKKKNKEVEFCEIETEDREKFDAGSSKTEE
mgnify:FL=1|tara:strand:- start:226 stop:474 length:249 start_codon:yes stop_codon:yes gene_type:complete